MSQFAAAGWAGTVISQGGLRLPPTTTQDYESLPISPKPPIHRPSLPWPRCHRCRCRCRCAFFIATVATAVPAGASYDAYSSAGAHLMLPNLSVEHSETAPLQSRRECQGALSGWEHHQQIKRTGALGAAKKVSKRECPKQARQLHPVGPCATPAIVHG